MRISDWSSDVCSSDLHRPRAARWRWWRLRARPKPARFRFIRRLTMRFKKPQVRYADTPQPATPYQADRKSVVSGKRVSVRVDLGGRRILKKKTQITRIEYKLLKQHNMTPRKNND